MRPAIAKDLRAAGSAVTEISASGKEGRMTVVNCVMNRKDVSAARAIVDRLDAEAFVTLDPVQMLHRGHFRS